MKLLLIITSLSLVITSSFLSYGQTSVTSKLNDAQRRLPMSEIQVDELDRYYDSQFIGRRVQRLERINMQMQGRIMFLENLVADIAMGAGSNRVGFNQQQMWTCSIQRQFIGTHQTKVGAQAKARDNCDKKKTNRNLSCSVWPSCEKHQI